MSEHTPTPWKADGLEVKCQQGTVATCPTPQKGGTFDCMDNAEFICLSCNCHDELVRTLQELRDSVHDLHCAKHPLGQSDLCHRAEKALTAVQNECTVCGHDLWWHRQPEVTHLFSVLAKAEGRS